MNYRDVTEVCVAPLTKEQRQRLECMTAVRGLIHKTKAYSSDEGTRMLSVSEIIELTEYLVTGRS
jgi:hypothetical protein